MNKKIICGLLILLHASNTIQPIDLSIFATRNVFSTKKIGFFENISNSFKPQKTNDQFEYIKNTYQNFFKTQKKDHKNDLKEAGIRFITMTLTLALVTKILESGVVDKILQSCDLSIQKQNTSKENFSTVAGNHEAKKDLADIINYLKNPESFHKIGAKPPRGILLTGKPGTGKTLLAKALAGEANCSFIACSGSDFDEVYIGVGASRIRGLFSEAKRKRPCVIFIDEIDALAAKRGGYFGCNEHDKTLNAFLTEMDGFIGREGIIVIAATNNPELLDPAVTRPGRFDRQIQVEMPDATCREEILKVHLQKIQHEPDLDTKKIAQATIGFSGADLANLVNEAAIIALNRGDSRVTMIHFEEARDKVQLGSKHPTMKQTALDKKVTAYHEAGHALILMLMPNQSNALNKITITPQGSALGVTHSIAQEDKYSTTEKELLATITMALGGRAAEELVFNEIATGASSDFAYASEIARAMICDYGMTNILGKQVLSQRPEFYAQDTLKKIDEGISKILEDQYLIAMNLLKENRDKLDKLANALLKKETLYAHEVYELLDIKPKTDFRLTA